MEVELELFGVTFRGEYEPATGRIYVPVSPESKLALAELGKVGREMIRENANQPIDGDTKS